MYRKGSPPVSDLDSPSRLYLDPHFPPVRWGLQSALGQLVFFQNFPNIFSSPCPSRNFIFLPRKGRKKYFPPLESGWGFCGYLEVAGLTIGSEAELEEEGQFPPGCLLGHTYLEPWVNI